MADAVTQLMNSTCRTCLIDFGSRQALIEHVCLSHMAYLPYECSVCRDRYATDQENRYKRTLGVSAEKIRLEHAHVHRDMYADPQQLPITNFPVPSKEKELLQFVDGPFTAPEEVDLLLMVDGDENRAQQQNAQVSPRKRSVFAFSPLKELKKKKFLADPETSSFDGDDMLQDAPLPVLRQQSSSASVLIEQDDDSLSVSTRSPEFNISLDLSAKASESQQMNEKQDVDSALGEKNAADQVQTKECPNCRKSFKDVIRHLRKCPHKVVDFPKMSPTEESSKKVSFAEDGDSPPTNLENDSNERGATSGEDGEQNPIINKTVLALTKDERVCPECNARLSDHRSLKRHALTVKKCAVKLVVYTAAPEPKENGPHHCSHCNHRFDSHFDVTAHLRFHHLQNHS